MNALNLQLLGKEESVVGMIYSLMPWGTNLIYSMQICYQAAALQHTDDRFDDFAISSDVIEFQPVEFSANVKKVMLLVRKAYLSFRCLTKWPMLSFFSKNRLCLTFAYNL